MKINKNNEYKFVIRAKWWGGWLSIYSEPIEPWQQLINNVGKAKFYGMEPGENVKDVLILFNEYLN